MRSGMPRACVHDWIICAEIAVYACARARLDHFVLLHHQPASFELSSNVKFGWYSAHHKLGSVTFAPLYHYNYYV